MVPALQSYLHQHKSLSIPGIGTIYIERTPARSDFTNKQILPPGYHYRFDRFFDTPDKQFFSFLARKKNMADYEAMRWYNEWAHELSTRLRTGSTFTWEGIGVIRKSDAGDILFETFAPIDAFLSPIPANRIVRSNSSHTMLVGDREFTNLEMSGYLNDADKHQPRKKPWAIYAFIFGALLLIVLFLYMYKN